MFDPTPEEISRQCRHHNQGDKERCQHGKHNRDGHGLKQLAFDTLQAKQRRKDNDDDQHCKEYRPANLARRFLNTQGNAVAIVTRIVGLLSPGCQLLTRRFIMILIRPGEMAEDMFHHYHRTIDHHADSDRQPSERHQIGRDTPLGHGHQCQTDGDRHRDQHQKAGTQIPEEQHQYNEDQDKGLQQGLADRFDGLVHQV